MPRADDVFGAQGGDLRELHARVSLDLSTCVNTYGPSCSVQQAIKEVSPDVLRTHPYAAKQRLESAYAEKLGVPENELVAGRGTTEFIWSFARILDHKKVAVPFPAYTDFMRSFPGRLRFSVTHGNPLDALCEQIDGVEWVLISNPNNPSGQFITRDSFYQLANRHKKTTIIIDESYIEFVDPTESTIGLDADNVVVLRSVSKFYGIGGVRAGIMWTRRADIRDMIERQQDTWPVSMIDVLLAEVALADSYWAKTVRDALRKDGEWLECQLRKYFREIVTGSKTHFRLMITPHSKRIQTDFLKQGVFVRRLTSGHGFDPGAIRIAAPRLEDRDDFLLCLREILM